MTQNPADTDEEVPVPVVFEGVSEQLTETSFLQSVVNATPDGIIAINEDGIIVFANQKIADVLGFPPDELVDRPFIEFLINDQQTEFLPADHITNGEGEEVDVQMRDMSGREITLHLDIRDLAVDGERLFAGFVRDHANIEKYDRTIDRYEAIAGMTGYGIYQLDQDGHFEMVNDTIVDETGYSREELLGAHTSKFLDEEAIARCEKTIRELLETEDETVATLEFDVYTAEEEPIPCEARITPLRSAGSMQGTIGVIRDVSERKERIEELRQERGLIEHVLETSPVGIGVITPNGDISRVNDRAEELLGLTMEEITSQTLDVSQRKLYDAEGEQVPPEDLLSRVFDEGEQVINSEFKLERPDSDRVWAAISIAPMTDDAGDVEKAVIIATDVTERKEREETLREERDVIEHILETSPVGIGVITPDGSISRVNDQAEELLGLTIEEITSQTLDVSQRRFYGASGQQVQPEDLLSRVFDDRERVLNTEFRLERPDGKRVWTALSMAPIESREGDVDKAVVIATDISDRKERERRLRESEARLRQIAENINNAIWMADDDLSEVLYINPAYETITGRSRDSVYDNLMNHLDAVHPQDQHRVDQAMREVTQTSRDNTRTLRFQEKYRIVRPDGAVRWVNSFAFPLQDDNGEVYRFVGVIDDITEVKEQQIELGRQRDELETLNQINTVIRRVNQGLVKAATREEIERQVCETLTDSKLYYAAWIGEVDGSHRNVETKTGAGIDNGSLNVSFDADTVDPIATAIESGNIQMIHDVGKLPSELAVDDSDGDGAFESGQSFAAVIPLVYKETVYDVLVAYSSRANAFSVREQAVLLELGKTIGLAINAVERKEALLTDTVVELEFEITDPEVFFVRASAETGVRFELEGVTSQSDGSYLQYFTVSKGSPEEVLEMAQDDDSITHARLVTDHNDAALLEFVVTGPSLATTLAEYGATVHTATVIEGTGTVLATLPLTADLRNVVNIVQSTFSESELISKRERERSVQTNRTLETALKEKLTERQQAILETAYYAGYFEWPRDSSGEEVAESLGIAPATFHQHARNGMRTLLESLVEEANV